MVNSFSVCKIDGTPLVLKQSKRTSEQLRKQFYYTAYYFCPQCKRMYFDDTYKIINQRNSFFTTNDARDLDVYDVEIWTDGSSSNNGKSHAKAAWAFVAGEYEEAGLVDGKQTNNRGEALAIYYALKWAAGKNHKKIRIHTDSQITIHGVTKLPERVKENRDIFERIHAVVTQHDLHVDYQKVLGHSGDPNNERADTLAVKLSLS